MEPCVLTIGAFQAGDAGNILPESAVLRGSIRTFNNDVRNFIKQRTVELWRTLQKVPGEAKAEFTSGVCPLINDGEFTREIVGYLGIWSLPTSSAPGSRRWALRTLPWSPRWCPPPSCTWALRVEDRPSAPRPQPQCPVQRGLLPPGYCCSSPLCHPVAGSPQQPADAEKGLTLGGPLKQI